MVSERTKLSGHNSTWLSFSVQDDINIREWLQTDSVGQDYVRRLERNFGPNYMCPNCGGGFNTWDEDDDVAGGKDVCPFCGIERRGYDVEE